MFATAELPTGNGAPWTAASLFCGAGGLDLGFLSEGVRTHLAFDNSRTALRNHLTNLPSRAWLADLSRHTPELNCDVLLAGAPCQGFSTAGKCEDEDPRNALLQRVAEVAIRSRPRVLVLENVPAALSGRHRRHWTALEDQLRLAGYNVRRMLLLGEESGVAQRRKRLFLLCWIGSDCIQTEFERVRPPSLRSTLAGVEAAENHRPNVPSSGSRDAMIAAAIGQGQKLCNVRLSPRAIPTWSIPGVFGQVSDAQREILEAVVRLRRRERRRTFGDGDPVGVPRIESHLGRTAGADIRSLIESGYLRDMGGEVELRHTYNGKYRRLSWLDTAPTVDTHFGRTSLFLHPEEHRGLSVREAARIQGFPDAYTFVGSRTEQFEAVGNAVPPTMAARIARFVREALLKR